MLFEPEPDRRWEVAPVYDSDPVAYSVLLEMQDHPDAQGQSDVGVRNLVYTTCINMRPRRVLEIGGHIGSAAIVIGSALRRNGYGKLISLEPHRPFADIARVHIAKAALQDRIEILPLFSFEPGCRARLNQEAPFDVIFVDGAHEYAAALADIELAADLLRPNGLMLLHDTGLYSPGMDTTGQGGVRRALYEFSRSRPDMVATFYEHPNWLNPCGAAMLCKQQLFPQPSDGALSAGCASTTLHE
jgi:predicted O-methyltransferase YrrM